MKYSLRGLRNAGFLFVSGILLTGCGALDPIKDAVLPDFTDEQLENPMASYVPTGGIAAVANQSPPGLAFSVTQAVSSAGTVPTANPPAFSAGLLEQAAVSGVNSADAALLDAALDVSPSQMGNSGASVGLVSGSLDDLMGFDALETSPSSGLAQAPIVSSLDASGSSFQVLSASDAQALIAGQDVIKYTSLERADLQTPYFAGRAKSQAKNSKVVARALNPLN